MPALHSLLSAVESPGCEALSDGLLEEPVYAITSLAFVIAAAWILLAAGRRRRAGVAPPAGQLAGHALLVAGVGVGSVIQHGPDPAWSDVAQDLPLLATLAFIAADAAADLTGRPRRWWWAVPTALLMPLVVAAPRPGDLAQVGVAGIAIGLTLVRAWRRPDLRRSVGWSLTLLAVGGIIGPLPRPNGPLCDPESIWQGHGVWHILAAAGLVALAPVIGSRRAVEAPLAAGAPPSGHDPDQAQGRHLNVQDAVAHLDRADD